MFGQDDQQNNPVSGVTPNPSTSDFFANNPAAPPAGTFGAPAAPLPVNDAPAAVPAAPGTDELLDIKQQALQQLSPLVSHLEQSPEEKFKTTMMMIQASDDQSLVKEAYETAKQITDEKARAQALLDIVNEINYFTQHHNN
ncbi:MAG: hypothetical protein JWL85_33 [Candidatus Saccharibacteria bacterium]|nr:hypothetical protein [Candidatus Saccharibacteria bacterium]